MEPHPLGESLYAFTSEYQETAVRFEYQETAGDSEENMQRRDTETGDTLIPGFDYRNQETLQHTIGMLERALSRAKRLDGKFQDGSRLRAIQVIPCLHAQREVVDKDFDEIEESWDLAAKIDEIMVRLEVRSRTCRESGYDPNAMYDEDGNVVYDDTSDDDDDDDDEDEDYMDDIVAWRPPAAPQAVQNDDFKCQ